MDNLQAGQSRRLPSACRSFLATAWQPMPLAMPSPVETLSGLGFMERSAAALAYQVLRLEYALSPAGHLRAWGLLSLKIGLVLAIPAVLVIPPATLILAGLATWSAHLAAIALNLLLALVYIVLFAAILSAVVGVARIRGSQGARPRF